MKHKIINLFLSLDYALTSPPNTVPLKWRERVRTHIFCTAGIKMWYGIWLLSPFWDAFAINPAAYGAMSMYASRWIWGTLFFVIGIVQMYALWADRYKLRSYIGYMSLALFLFLTGMLMQSNIGISGVATYGWLAVCDIISSVITRVPRIRFLRKGHDEI